jgi:hypothetical protein
MAKQVRISRKNVSIVATNGSKVSGIVVGEQVIVPARNKFWLSLFSAIVVTIVSVVVRQIVIQ